jgi:transposase InsO family protein
VFIGSLPNWHLLDKCLQRVYIRPSTLRLNGNGERSHRIDDEEFYPLLAGEVIDDAMLFNNKLHEWERFHNFARPHGALGGLTPYERLRQLTRPSV